MSHLRILIGTLAIAVVTAVSPAIAAATPSGYVNDGPLLFYNSGSGAGATGAVDVTGTYIHLRTLSGFSRDWSHITAAGRGQLLFYNAQTGAGVIGRVGSDGSFTSLRSMTFQRGWTTITYAENGIVLFYNANTGAAATGSVNEYGDYRNLRTMTVNSGWTQIVSVGAMNVMFYNATSGAVSVGRVGSDGVFSHISNGTTSPGWTHVATAGGHRVLFYRASNGLGLTASVDWASGRFVPLRSATFNAGYSTVVFAGESVNQATAVSHPHVLFYSASTGAASTGEIASTGVYTNLHDHWFSTGWTHIASAVSNGPSPIK